MDGTNAWVKCHGQKCKGLVKIIFIGDWFHYKAELPLKNVIIFRTAVTCISKIKSHIGTILGFSFIGLKLGKCF